MIVVRLEDDKQGLQLRETLLEAGFTNREISLSYINENNTYKVRTQMTLESSLDRPCRITVHTKTQMDEDLAKTVFRDCSIRPESIETKSAFGPLVLIQNRPGDIPLGK